mmetsp:Transcript_11412/g.17211  ORF Transcript_11412/g.17211 Transcript_11412/m.17211 type:complete len:191 (+) Transcript_11412:49-621(+)|eukprot:CAMPEP_0194777252 /NCGR_PEP_ID=MMETSP0323_2-20130528/65213_1 /TAXON_ID=2866 ORGANISM="Crypthecodinium cohnii, Strain Seligo" /NCGR_SAMPLE_ID=MMETSP0323_2 /ASSEMBLY_ACC=CAM_ASM_000346 /LENGTH=190 /DNA_ID=CAMNT_0039713987 /DNA_START=23 /DNA_END=595 /DNA_ORIENTATION=+
MKAAILATCGAFLLQVSFSIDAPKGEEVVLTEGMIVDDDTCATEDEQCQLRLLQLRASKQSDPEDFAPNPWSGGHVPIWDKLAEPLPTEVPQTAQPAPTAPIPDDDRKDKAEESEDTLPVVPPVDDGHDVPEGDHPWEGDHVPVWDKLDLAQRGKAPGKPDELQAIKDYPDFNDGNNWQQGNVPIWDRLR